MAFRQELIDEAVDCRRGNGEHAATRSENSHADDASLRIDEGAAFSGCAEHQIHADEVVNGTAAKTVPRPSHSGDDAEVAAAGQMAGAKAFPRVWLSSLWSEKITETGGPRARWLGSHPS